MTHPAMQRRERKEKLFSLTQIDTGQWIATIHKPNATIGPYHLKQHALAAARGFLSLEQMRVEREKTGGSETKDGTEVSGE